MLDFKPNSTPGERFRVLGHLLAAVIILLKADVLREHHRTLAIVLILLAVLFILASVFHRRIESFSGITGDSVLFVLEAGVLALIAYELTAEHKHYPQYAYVLAAVMYVVAAIIFPLRHRRHA